MSEKVHTRVGPIALIEVMVEVAGSPKVLRYYEEW